jgi:hypothetical protein
MSRRSIALGVVAVLAAAGRSAGQAGPAVVVQDPYLGPVVAAAPAAVAAVPVTTAAVPVATAAQPAAAPVVLQTTPRNIWPDAVEAGVNGATGNTKLLNLRGGWNGQWRTDGNDLLSDLLYLYAWQTGATTAQQAFLNTRDDARFPDPAWFMFGANQLEYDELRGYRFRVGSYSGLGYVVADDDTVLFKLRGGAGRVWEMGSRGLPDRWVTEAMFGYDFQYRLSERSAFMSALDYFPRVDDFGQFRVRFRAAYQYVLDPDTGTVLRFGVVERYDSDPGFGLHNDLTYYTTIGLRF